MRLDGTQVLVCDCESTMPLDGKALAKACGAKEGGAAATQLCRAEIGWFQQALKDGGPLLVACTQEAPLFEEQRAEAGAAGPISFVNIRETAGWSSEAADALPKMAALIQDALIKPPTLPTVSMKSEGVTLILGRDEKAIELGRQLSSRLDITIMLERGADVAGQPLMDLPVVQGKIRAAKGHLGAFELVVDDFALPLPSSRGRLAFGLTKNGASSRCDVIIDLTGGRPLFSAHEKRDGYFRPDPKDPVAVQRAAFEASDLVGEFEKPLYVTYHPDLCAHGRSRKTGCTRCLDVCPTGAIAPNGDKVSFDPFVCAGCGSCGAVCPTGAADYRLPPAATLAARLRALLVGYREAGGERPVLLVHDSRHGAPLIDALARHGQGLPARVLPMAVHSITELGIDFFATAFAYGAAEIRVLAAPKRDDLLPLAQQFGLAEALLGGLGFGSGRLGLIETADPDQLAAALAVAAAPALPLAKGTAPAAHLPMGGKRDIARQAFRELHRQAPQPVAMLGLPAGAPFGTVQINAEGCTLCLSCVGACPTGALADDPERPRLTFTEDACVQCGLCKATCPEKVIALEPRLNFAPEAAAARLIKQEEPFHCVRCGKAFGTKSSIESIVAKLEGKHWMFKDSAMLDRIKMCADCRVVVQSEVAIDPYAGPPRPAVRTTDDYLAERAAAQAAAEAAEKKRS